MVVPKSFLLVNREWRVVYDNDLEGETLGESRHEKAEIALRPGLPPRLEYHTFLHELCHAFCYSLGWKDLNESEGSIDALSGILHQYLMTKVEGPPPS